MTDGCVFRAINKGGRVYGDGLTANIVWSIVRGYAAEIGVPQLAPHDLRRTCAKLMSGRRRGPRADSASTWARFHCDYGEVLGSRLDLTNAVNDDLGLTQLVSDRPEAPKAEATD